ncbi:MAG: twin-arginine translocase TatA/TatE family subunit [Candidatus Neomarinimicrobiota bacterium]|nr:twin-arginine translocase TatA/TatE family subunit [Candidatus Neomarinimicrobiota bacterium]MEC8839387.1 twin-arginine translocase TatA/TatE family subunit [Candidatus Neomarinimicrobiota bacterium]MEC9273756.1 twin-arginine translocase TatA/TatE family subunit [Candidatus Neomarinimicrobiota bacterium]|tara:strand:- start:2 stop:232 length:231 start_codon:yes stop_codon:yes gene_type:complete
MLESSETLIRAAVPGGWEWVIIALVVLLLFGAKRIPELARGLGQGIREFKGAVDDAKQELDDAAETITSDSDKSDE